jgi:hypothetical protein
MVHLGMVGLSTLCKFFLLNFKIESCPFAPFAEAHGNVLISNCVPLTKVVLSSKPFRFVECETHSSEMVDAIYCASGMHVRAHCHTHFCTLHMSKVTCKIHSTYLEL